MKHTHHPRTIIFSATLLLTPALALAAPANLKEFAVLVVNIFKGAAAVIFASLAVAIIYGVVLYMVNSDSEQKREQIRGYLLWAIIGIAVAFGMWGILAMLSGTFGLGGVGIPILSAPA